MLSSADVRVSSELIASSAIFQRGLHMGTYASHRGSNEHCAGRAFSQPTGHTHSCAMSVQLIPWLGRWKLPLLRSSFPIHVLILLKLYIHQACT